MNPEKPPSFGIKPKDVIIALVAEAIGTGFTYLLTQIYQLTSRGQLEFLTAVFAVQVLVLWAVAYFTRQRVTEEQKSALQAQFDKRIEAINAENERKIADAKLKENEIFRERTDAHHWFAHYARDLAIKLTGDYKKPNTFKLNLPGDVKSDVENMIGQVYKTFRYVVPPETKMFAAIRERRGDKYHTIMRFGDIDHARRKKLSRPLDKSDLLVKSLIEEFKNDECVMLTGTGDPHWTYEDHDHMHKSVLLGAIFSKRWNESKAEFVPIRLEWILSIAANEANTFQKWHRPLMRCFNDTCGLLVNVSLRHQMNDEQRNPPPPPAEGHDTWD